MAWFESPPAFARCTLPRARPIGRRRRHGDNLDVGVPVLLTSSMHVDAEVAKGAGIQVPLRHAAAGDLIGLAALLSGTEILTSEVVTDTTLLMLWVDQLRALASVHACPRNLRVEGFVDNPPRLVIVVQPEALARIARGARRR